MIIRLTLIWVLLLLLYAIEIVLALNHLGVFAVFPAAVMIGLTAWYFMRLREASSLTRIFALAGVFWLTIMFGLGIMDPFTRIDHPVLIETTH